MGRSIRRRIEQLEAQRLGGDDGRPDLYAKLEAWAADGVEIYPGFSVDWAEYAAERQKVWDSPPRPAERPADFVRHTSPEDADRLWNLERERDIPPANYRLDLSQEERTKRWLAWDRHGDRPIDRMSDKILRGVAALRGRVSA